MGNFQIGKLPIVIATGCVAVNGMEAIFCQILIIWCVLSHYKATVYICEKALYVLTILCYIQMNILDIQNPFALQKTNLSSMLLKDAFRVLSIELTYIINETLRTATFPDAGL